jgi:hypothetical protein
VTASEFAFLALGLVLGIAVGAALVEVARSRPPARREVRVTVAPNSIRSRASTLADEGLAGAPAGPARGGPADRRWVERGEESDHDDTTDDTPDVPTAGASGDLSTPASTRPPANPPEDAPPNETPVPFVLRPLAAGPGGLFLNPSPLAAGAAQPGPGRSSVGIPISREADPMMDALRVATPAGSAGANGTSGSAGAASPVAHRDGQGLASGGGGSSSGASLGSATITRPESPASAATGGGGDAAGGDRSSPARGRRGAGGSARSKGGKEAIVEGDDIKNVRDTGPCADQRRVADERCAVATRAREGARQAAEAHRMAQRDYDDHVGSAENFASAADPRSVRTAKETAQQAFRRSRAAASTRETVETAARDWLTEINRINLATREANARAEHHRTAATALAPALERLALEADAARISAESAEEACVAAREAVAVCEEAATAAAENAAHLVDRMDPEDQEGTGTETGVAAAASVAEPTEFEDDEAMGSRAGEDAAIIRLLRGDREILPRIVARLGGDDPDEQRRWRGLLTDLVEALVARSIEAAAFDFPAQHPFWGPFTRAQSRDIAAALASLGYRHDGFGDWADDRAPSQRDLSLAVGYAGLDPMRIRKWPSEAEMGELLRNVTVAADEYVWEAAGALTLGELVSLLGRRADSLTDLWNEWGTVRPLLLSGG